MSRLRRGPTAVLTFATWIGFCGPARAQEEAAAKPVPQARYARVLVEETTPRCFAGPRSPSFPDRLVAGQIVRVGEARDGFLRVFLPDGVTGYVHRKFTTEPQDGKIRTTGTNVSFRYRPRSGEPPAVLLRKGTELVYLGEQGDWWKVRCRDAEAWLPAAEVQVLDGANSTAEAAYTTLARTRRAQASEAAAKREAALAEQRRLAEARARLAELAERLRREAAKDPDEQDLETLEKELATLTRGLPEDSPLAAQAKLLAGEIRRQRWLVEALAAVREKPETKDVARDLVPERTPDRLARFQAIGWLRQKSLAGRRRYVLEKGGRILLEVTCESGRYDLSWFEDLEVGVIGAKRSGDPDRIRSLDVERLEVLGKDR